ncbi:GNAT family N-acetyltransferase [Amantichitinum ursilacus]|uniref:Acetyltransferase (GNAT) family protein n=1 Tax=Amantichitinum ursilacus TaxID=857265 RepID=A0A0N0GQJ8_9NEIS|nr:GNAT family N-acetyltransferase [Amantichitinum ursilacus]KPC54852.1 Acetyltransferase (GNAT) family protein [Amantichitinum ursilacus]
MTPRPDNAALLGAILALDLLTLPTHTEQAGDVFDVAQHRASLAAALASAQVVTVERNGQVVAYALLLPDTADCAFVSGFCIHPDWRNASVTQALVSGVFKLARRAGVSTLRSHVYKTNALSLAFHHRLGFTITRENAKAVEFHLPLANVLQSATLRRIAVRAA